MIKYIFKKINDYFKNKSRMLSKKDLHYLRKGYAVGSNIDWLEIPADLASASLEAAIEKVSNKKLIGLRPERTEDKIYVFVNNWTKIYLYNDDEKKDLSSIVKSTEDLELYDGSFVDIVVDNKLRPYEWYVCNEYSFKGDSFLFRRYCYSGMG